MNTKLANTLDLNLLRVFNQLMQQRNVTAVAKTMHLSQSTISHALSRLRNQLNDPLFVLVGKEMQPTEKAMHMAPAIQQALLLIQQGVSTQPHFDPKHDSRHFKIAVGGAIEQTYIAPIIKRLATFGPHLRLDVFELTNSDYEKELERNTLDLVIGFAGSGHLSDKLLTTHLVENPLSCITDLSFTPSIPGKITAEELVSRSHIYTSSWGHSQQLMDNYFQQRQLKRQVAAQVPTFTAVPKLLMDGHYLVVMPEMVATELCLRYPLQQLAIIDDPITVSYEIAQHPLTSHDIAINWLKSLIIEVCASTH
ncbi:LysR family transcriptional regulator [Motilimonas eburnea]|uniref:LysR family transcriptional regulator n=1 Tax=Motilimonas eburnea TaxID=1737488 RepID=UPI001E53CCC6|nr:LysR family transcriptional regulator [Motilimonas eburnea]MCE2572454.1 LysR family transcriptional regulator [Motilimonas eburnea]